METKYKRNRILIKDLLQNYETYLNQIIISYGWIQSVRKQADLNFIAINDGSCITHLQIILSNEYYKDNIDEIKDKLDTGASIKVNGLVIESPASGQKVELQCHNLEIIGEVGEGYPLPKTALTPDFLRQIPHMRIRRQMCSSIAKIRNSIMFSTHLFMKNNDYKLINTPLITSNDCEGAGESFTITNMLKNNIKDIPCDKDGKIDYSKDFFGQKAGLTVSGQLNLETSVPGLCDTYTLGPTFRAENSQTSRHLAEFWMFEIESAFMDLKSLMDLSEDYVKFCINEVLNENKDELDFLCKIRKDEDLINNLNKVIENDFARVSYTEAIEILEENIKNYKIILKSNYPNISDKDWKKKSKNKDVFENPVFWGIDMNSEHEKWLCEKHFKKPVFVYNYPKEIKSFYMKENINEQEDRKTVQAVDLLIPGVGELIGGSVRESSYDNLVKRMKDKNIKEEPLQWYIDLRRFGYGNTAGMGCGIERLISFISGTTNIRDCIQFPRFPGSIFA